MSIRLLSATLLVFLLPVFANSLEEKASTWPYNGNVKEEIDRQKIRIESSDPNQKGLLLQQLSLLYLKDQDHESAFRIFLDALDCSCIESSPFVCEQEEKHYKMAKVIYLAGSGSTKENAEEIVNQFSLICKENPQLHLLGFLVALANANLGRYDKFFHLFYPAYCSHEDHFLVHKTKAILHIKLYERCRQETEREAERESICRHLNVAMEKEANDYTLYKLLICFAPEKKKDEITRRCLNKIIDTTMIIPRSEVGFFVQLAVDSNDCSLAERLLEKARGWYPKSRVLDNAKIYLDAHK